MCLNVKAFGAVAELHPYRVTWRNIAVALTTRESVRHWANKRQTGNNPETGLWEMTVQTKTVSKQGFTPDDENAKDWVSERQEVF